MIRFYRVLHFGSNELLRISLLETYCRAVSSIVGETTRLSSNVEMVDFVPSGSDSTSGIHCIRFRLYN